LNSEDDNGQGRRISHCRFNAARQLAIVIYIWLANGSCGFSAEESGSPSRFGPDPQQYQRSVDRAIEYLRSHGQSEDGSFNSRAGVGITALVTTAVLRHGRGVGDPLVAKSLKYLGDAVQSDGGIYAKGGWLPNYETCMVIMCLTEANKDERYSELIRNAEAFIRRSQWSESVGKDPTGPSGWDDFSGHFTRMCYGEGYNRTEPYSFRSSAQHTVYGSDQKSETMGFRLVRIKSSIF